MKSIVLREEAVNKAAKTASTIAFHPKALLPNVDPGRSSDLLRCLRPSHLPSANSGMQIKQLF